MIDSNSEKPGFFKRWKRCILITIIIISVLTLIWAFIDYFDVIRNIRLHTMSIEKFKQKYDQLPRGDTRTVLSLNLTNTNNYNKSLASLFDQNERVDEISVDNLSHENHSYISQIEKYINVYNDNKDYERNNKIIPTLLREKEGDTIIIIADIGPIYENNLIQTIRNELIQKQKPVQGKKGVIAFFTKMVPEHFVNKASKDSLHDVIDIDTIDYEEY